MSLKSISSILVPSQTDYNFLKIASNQCSWIAIEFIINNNELIKSINILNIKKFSKYYRKCMLKGSGLRRKIQKSSNENYNIDIYGDIILNAIYGENIDTPILLENYKNILKIENKYTIIKNENNEFLNILHEDLKKEFYTRKYNIIDETILLTIISSLHEKNQGLLVSRHGQSLSIMPVKEEKYIICDSHYHHSQILDKTNTLKHILMDNGGHLHLTILLVNL
jgi:hypothetical protein